MFENEMFSLIQAMQTQEIGGLLLKVNLHWEVQPSFISQLFSEVLNLYLPSWKWKVLLQMLPKVNITKTGYFFAESVVFSCYREI